MRTAGGVEPAVGEQVVAHLRSWLAGRLPGTVAAYLAMSDEVDVTPLFIALPGWRWVLPRLGAGDTLTLRDAAVPHEMHELGMSQPVDAGEMIPAHQLDLILVPGLAFDGTGGRLGRGGGHYDRLLGEIRADARSIGVTVDDRLIDTVPMEPHDRPVQFIATESGVRECLPIR
jgi:5-formyltetrahydrofolate cyclo-ligase